MGPAPSEDSRSPSEEPRSPSEEPVSVFGARGEPPRFREKDGPGGPYAPRLDLSSLFVSTPEDSVDTRTSWGIAKEIMLWTGVVVVVAFFIIKVFINPNSDNDDGSDSDGGKPLPQSSLRSLLSLSF